MLKPLPVLILTLIFTLNVLGQDSIKKIKLLPVPTIGYSPETKTYVGVVSLFTFNLYDDTITRTSNAKLEFNYTWNKQLILETEWNYFFKQEEWFTKGKIHYSSYPDYYYGVGSNTPDSNKLLFNSNRMVFEVSILKKVGRNFFTGANIKYQNYRNVNSIGANHYPELTDRATFGVGFTLLSDSRDNLLTPTKGFYFNFNAGFNFSKQNYGESAIDLRYYKTWKEKYTWANRFINEFNFGTPAFFDYAFLGGDKFVRGYNYGRYRDKNLTSFQTEIRFPVIRRFGLAAFGGISDLFNGSNLKLKETKPNYGMGLRFLIDKHDKTNLRLDYAIGGEGNSGFYISFGESF